MATLIAVAQLLDLADAGLMDWTGGSRRRVAALASKAWRQVQG
jgi:hypothetical protein